MVEENNGVSDTPDSTVSDSVQETQTTDVSNVGNQTVQYHTHKKLLGQHKKLSDEFQSLQEQLKSLQNEKYESEGDKDKLIESLKKEVAETKTKLRSTVGTVAHTQAMNAIVEEAVKAGCNAPDVVKKFLQDKVETVTFDEAFNPDRDQIKELIQEARTSAPVLFSKEAPGIANHNKITSGDTSAGTNNVKKMSREELMQAWSSAE